MILSDPETYEPKVIYKEIKNYEGKESLLYDTIFIKIANKLDLPIYKFIYSENSNNVLLYRDLKTGNEIKNMNIDSFLEMYSSFL